MATDFDPNLLYVREVADEPEAPPPFSFEGLDEATRRALLFRAYSPWVDEFDPPDAADPTELGQATLSLSPSSGLYGGVTNYYPQLPVLELVQKALNDYYSGFQPPEPEVQPYPWRLVVARHTGLPAALRGFLSEPLPQADADYSARVATDWLFEDARANALFGAPAAEMVSRYRQSGVVQLYPPAEEGGEQEQEAAALVHVHYQQWHGDWPVFGGGVVVHMASGDQRAAVTSSYFPIEPDQEFVVQVGSERAIELAVQALAASLDDVQAAGLCWWLLRPRLKMTGGEWRPADARLAGKLLRATSQADSDLLAAAGSGLELDSGLARRLAEAGAALESSGLADWRVDIVPYADAEEETFVLPFGGSYHLAYQVQIVSPDRSQAWRVHVDAEEETVLGHPESLVRHAQIFASAADALGGIVAAFAQPLQDNPCQDFMEIDLFATAAVPNWPMLGAADLDVEVANVAVHAHEFYEHVVNVCGVPAASLQRYEEGGQVVSPGLRARVGKPGPQLDMGFIHLQGQHPKEIVFQSGILQEGGREVQDPARDPEVVYHEMAHGLMWLLNRRPFENLTDTVPFGSALLEGAASYLARSLAEQRGDVGDDLWARAAYRRGGATGWGDRWALVRSSALPGADLLPAPNVYPHQQTTGLAVYDVGMIWARALWDLRTIVGAQRADRLVFDAYNYVPGWIANFEMAAEGIIDAAAKAGIEGLDEAGSQLFARRGILAGQGVQALLSAGNVLLAGSDAGLMRSTNGGATWQSWDDLGGGGKLAGVVALAFDAQSDTFYAAVETQTAEEALAGGVYQRASNAGQWTPLGAWPAGETPYALAVVGRELCAGTGHGVQRKPLDNLATNWAKFNGACEALTWPALDLAPTSALGAEVLCVAAFDALRYRALSAQCWVKKPVDVGGGERTAVVAVAAEGDTVYLGTLKWGIRRWVMGANHLDEIASAADLGGGAVLSLSLSGDTLAAGTTAGLFVGARGGGGAWAWSALTGLPAGAKVVSVLLAGDLILAATDLHGVWRWQRGAAGWPVGQRLSDLDGLAGQALTGLVPGVLGPFAVAAGHLRLHMFRQPQPQVQLSVEDANTGQALAGRATAYHLGQGVAPLARVGGPGDVYNLPEGLIVVAVENATAGTLDYRLRVP